jgi:hypothetical protein
MSRRLFGKAADYAPTIDVPAKVISQVVDANAARDIEFAKREARSRALSKPDDGLGWPTLAIVLVLVGVGMGIAITHKDGTRTAATFAPVAPAGLEQHGQRLDSAIATFKANMRLEADGRSKVVQILNRGTLVRVVSAQNDFAQIETESGEKGYVYQPLLVPAGDARRLALISASDYLKGPRGQQIDWLAAQLANRPNALSSAIEALRSQSEDIGKWLVELEPGDTLLMKPDPPAATWFSLSSQNSTSEGRLQDAQVEAIAAAEAVPTDPALLVTMGRASYKVGDVAAVIRVGNLLPRLAPRLEQSWTMFALAETLKDYPDEELAGHALVLAVRLASNPSATRRLLAEMAKLAVNPRTRTIFEDGLEEERQRPDLFSGLLRSPT